MLKQTTLDKLSKIDQIFKDKYIGYPYNVFTVDVKKKTVTPLKENSEYKFTENIRRSEACKMMLENSLKVKFKGKKYHSFRNSIFQIIIWLRDQPPEQYRFLDDETIFVFAKQRNDKRYILFPDHSYLFFEGTQGQNKLYLNLDEVKDIIEENKIPLKNKINTFYFVGSDTTKHKDYNIRNNLSKVFAENIFLRDFYKYPDLYEPIFFLNKYKYLLNLTGNANWSLRLKYLMMITDSYAVNVKSNIINITKNSIEKPYVTIFEEYFLEGKEDEYAIPIYTEHFEYNPKSPNAAYEKKKVEEKNKKSFEKLVETLSNIDKLPKPKKKFNMKRDFTLSKIYEYVYDILVFLDSSINIPN